MSNMVEFAKALAAEAERRGLRIVIEPIKTTSEPTVATTNPPTETHETKPVSKPTETISVPKIVSPTSKEIAKEEHSWLTVSQCARMMDVSTEAIYRRIRHGVIPVRRIAGRPMEVNTSLLNGLPAIPKGCSSWSKNPIPVECVETGKRYKSIHATGRAFGVNTSTIQDSIAYNRAVHGLYHFRKIEN